MSPNTPSKKKKLLIAGLIFLLPVIAIVIAVISLMPGSKSAPTAQTTQTAFNTHLPEPNLKKEGQNKLEIYIQAQQDSLRHKQEVDHDPLANKTAAPESLSNVSKIVGMEAPFHGKPVASFPTPSAQDANEKKVNEHLQKLYAALNGPESADPDKKMPTGLFQGGQMPDSYQTARLQKMMDNLKAADTATNPQLQQINAVLDKVLAIRNPVKTPDPANPGNSIPNPLVGTSPVEADPLENAESEINGFFGLSDEPDSTVKNTSIIRAVVHDNQTIVSGAIVKLRLLQDIYIGSAKIPANSFIYGPCSINGERVNIQLTNAIYDGQIYPVQLKVYDGTDGLEGLFVPGAITRDVIKDGMSQNISGLNVGTFDPSLGAQAASAGIETAKNLLSRKVRLVKATLVVGHLAILRNPDNRH